MKRIVITSLAVIMSGCVTHEGADARNDGEMTQPSVSYTQDPTCSADDFLRNGSMPKLLFGPEPDYSSALGKAGVTGRVVVEFAVTAKGEVVGAFALPGARPELAVAAVRAVRRWRFRPGEIRGRTVAVRMQQVFVFSTTRVRDDAVTLSPPFPADSDKERQPIIVE